MHETCAEPISFNSGWCWSFQIEQAVKIHNYSSLRATLKAVGVEGQTDCSRSTTEQTALKWVLPKKGFLTERTKVTAACPHRTNIAMLIPAAAV